MSAASAARWASSALRLPTGSAGRASAESSARRAPGTSPRAASSRARCEPIVANAGETGATPAAASSSSLTSRAPAGAQASAATSHGSERCTRQRTSARGNASGPRWNVSTQSASSSAAAAVTSTSFQAASTPGECSSRVTPSRSRAKSQTSCPKFGSFWRSARDSSPNRATGRRRNATKPCHRRAAACASRCAASARMAASSRSARSNAAIDRGRLGVGFGLLSGAHDASHRPCTRTTASCARRDRRPAVETASSASP